MKRAWFLGGGLLVLVALVVVGTLVEKSAPAAQTPVAEPNHLAPDPASASSSSVAAVPSLAVAPTYFFPVVAANATYARTHHDYPAADVIAPCNSKVVAVTDGVILEVSRQDAYSTAADDGALRGGLFVSLLGDDGVRYYGSHFRSIQSGVNAGVRVRAGDQIGLVGDSGDASVCHLHFGISPPCSGTGDWWVRRGAIWPAPYLDAWRKKTSTSPAPEITTWSKAHGCPGAPT